MGETSTRICSMGQQNSIQNLYKWIWLQTWLFHWRMAGKERLWAHAWMHSGHKSPPTFVKKHKLFPQKSSNILTLQPTFKGQLILIFIFWSLSLWLFSAGNSGIHIISISYEEIRHTNCACSSFIGLGKLFWRAWKFVAESGLFKRSNRGA